MTQPDDNMVVSCSRSYHTIAVAMCICNNAKAQSEHIVSLL